MAEGRSRVTYKEFMEQLDAAKARMGKAWYKMLEEKFAKAKTHKTH